MYIPCEDCYRRYQKEYTKECDAFCDYAKMVKENKEFKKNELLNKQIKDMDILISRLETSVNALNRIGIDALNKSIT